MNLESRTARYALAIASTAAAVLVRHLLDPILGTRIPYATFYVSVIVTALAGGAGPAILSAVLGAASAAYFWLPPRGRLYIEGTDNLLGFGLYLCVCAVLIGIAESERRAQRRADRRRLEAERESALRARAEATERAERTRFEVTLASIGDGVIATSNEGRVTLINAAAARLTGWQPAEAAGQPIETVFRIFHEETGAVVENPAIRALSERRTVALTNHTVLITKTGGRLPIDDSGAPIFDAAGNVIGSVLIFRDVSEAKSREAELRNRSRMIDLAHDAIIVTDARRRIRSWNLGAAEIYGWTEDEARGNVLHELLHTRGPEGVEAIDKTLRAQGRWDGELIHTHKDGRELISESRQASLRDASGEPQGVMEINREVGERRRLEERLREAAKLESLGVLAGGIAHDFNNLLTGVLGYASLLAESLTPDSPEGVCATQIVASAERAANLTQQMLAYSGQGRVAVEPLDISRVVRETAPLLEASIDKNVKLVLDLADGLPLADVDPAQIQQLVINIAVNGAEALAPAGGRLTLRTRKQELDDAYVRNLKPERGELRPGQHVVIEVTDTGVGMDEATLARIFDPFFSTKFTGRGLGLAAAQGIVRAHKGAIAVESVLGRGTTFRILLPVSEAARSEGAPPRAAIRPVFRGTALVIDDEVLVRSLAKDALESLGFAALTARDGQEGIHLFRAASRSIRLVLLDMTMPGISAEETVRGIRDVRTDVPILLCSGFSEAEAVRRFGSHNLAGFLQKPYTVDFLSEKIAVALASGPSSESFASAP